MKKNNNKGFTLMEMLIVVAIIAILIAIAIPTFTGALNKARDASDIANGRALYAALTSDIMLDDLDEGMEDGATCDAGEGITYNGTEYKFNSGCAVVINTNEETNKAESATVTVTLSDDADEEAYPNGEIVFGPADE